MLLVHEGSGFGEGQRLQMGQPVGHVPFVLDVLLTGDVAVGFCGLPTSISTSSITARERLVLVGRFAAPSR